jgi:hypothetical protein
MAGPRPACPARAAPRPAPGSPRLVRAALRCYPRRWRGRHGEEAAELAVLLIRDGTAARSIAWSYARGAAGAWLVPPSCRLGATVGALLAAACSLGIALALLSSSAPASAASAHRAHAPSPARPAARPWPPRCAAVPGEDEFASWHGQHC